MDILDEEKKGYDKAKNIKIIKIIIILLVVLFLATIGILYAIYYTKSKEFKVVIDGTQNTKLTSDDFIIDGDTIYVSIKDVAPYLGDYTYNNGGYKEYSEDKTSCYLKNDYEAASFALNSSTIYKSIISDGSSETSTSSKSSTGDTNYEYFTIDEPVKMINNKLYTTADGISIGCNVAISYNQKNNTVTIYTLSKLVNYYTTNMSGAAIAGDSALFSNKKAVLYDLIVVADSKGEYGVNNTSGEEVIGEKYSYIKFIESSQEFIVKTDEGKMGILSKDGTTRIKPEYDEIQQIDKDKGLYLVSNNGKYGVINKNGKVVIYLEYEKIGVDITQYASDSIKNSYILYDNCIPVEKGEKWGLMDVNGNTLVEPQYDSLGCIIGTSTTKTANNLLLVPKYEAIVVCKDKLYGLINSSGKELIPALVTSMYSITSSGENTYYLIYNKQTLNIIDYLKNTLGIQPVDEDTSGSDDLNNIISNETTVNNVTTNNISSISNSVNSNTTVTNTDNQILNNY